jgi:hypothetical protein
LDCTVDIFSIQHLDFDILNLKKMKWRLQYLQVVMGTCHINTWASFSLIKRNINYEFQCFPGVGSFTHFIIKSKVASGDFLMIRSQFNFVACFF